MTVFLSITRSLPPRIAQERRWVSGALTSVITISGPTPDTMVLQPLLQTAAQLPVVATVQVPPSLDRAFDVTRFDHLHDLLLKELGYPSVPQLGKLFRELHVVAHGGGPPIMGGGRFAGQLYSADGRRTSIAFGQQLLMRREKMLLEVT